MDKKRLAHDFKYDDHTRFRVGDIVKIAPAWIFATADLWTSPPSLFSRDVVIRQLAPGELCLVLAVDISSYKVITNDVVGWVDFNEVVPL